MTASVANATKPKLLLKATNLPATKIKPNNYPRLQFTHRGNIIHSRAGQEIKLYNISIHLQKHSCHTVRIHNKLSGWQY